MLDWNQTRLHVVTGKGGTGKTTTAVTLATVQDRWLARGVPDRVVPAGDAERIRRQAGLDLKPVLQGQEGDPGTTDGHGHGIG